MAELILLTRPDCGLCETFYAELAAAFPDIAPRLRIADVDWSEDWRARFGLRIPVLVSDGAVICEAVFDEGRMRAWIEGD